MKTFKMYRREDISETHTPETVNPPDEIQFEGVIFSDGKTVIKWCTEIKSVSVFDTFTDMMQVHGHPEYGSEIVWT